MATSNASPARAAGVCQPNAFDRKLIELALRERTRYRYVTPAVRIVEGGLRIESPCCSRRVDADGGVVDIALLLRAEPGEWRLYCKNHQANQWLMYGTYETLAALLEELKNDPQQKFWQ